MATDYNSTAWFYDTLSKLVFGQSIVKAQVALLQFIPANSKVLIVGGGTGWILEKIAKTHSGLEITYAEAAPNMVSLSRKRYSGNNTVIFINKEIEDIILPKRFDVVLTPFFFSNFNEAEVKRLFTHINSQLNPDGIWLNADFQIAGKWWHKAMLQTMYLFFSLFGAVNNSMFTEVTTEFEKAKYQLINAQTFYGDFITAKAWRKANKRLPLRGGREGLVYTHKYPAPADLV